MTPLGVSGTVEDVEIRDSAVNRALANPYDRDRENEGQRTSRKLHGSCTTPVILPYEPDPMEKAEDHELWVRCRNCPGCIRARRYLWTMRAQEETLRAERTWLFTGTFREQFHELEPVKEECTRYLKRLRKRFPGCIRYLLVPEEHKSGALHIHALLHGTSELSYRDVRSAWGAGFSDARICNWRGAGYVTKYVTKELGKNGPTRRPRIRASRNPTYGESVMERDAELLALMMQSRPKEELQEIWRKNIRMVLEEKRLQKKSLFELMKEKQ